MQTKLILSVWFTFLVVIFTASCVKEGPQGPAGLNGQDGVDGIDGLDGTEKCSSCHASNTDLYAKQLQYRNSVHATGGNFFRNATSCAICHTHEGFLERLENGGLTTAAPIQDPTPINCRTCHLIHENYDVTDYQLRVTGPVQLINGGTVDFGKGNMCINCHQSRPYDLPIVGTDSTTITSSRWGTHHGPQSALIFGLGGYEGPGPMDYTGSPHKDVIPDGCISCHMATAFGNSGGGHTLQMYYGENETPNVVACTPCHTGATDFNINGAQDDIEALLAELEDLLITEGVLNPNSGLWNTGTYRTEVAGAAINWIFIEEDRSKGVHNYKYAKALLTNSIEALKQ